MDNPVRFPSRSWEGPTNLAPPMDDKMANTGAAPQAQNSYKAACTLSAPNQPPLLSILEEGTQMVHYATSPSCTTDGTTVSAHLTGGPMA